MGYPHYAADCGDVYDLVRNFDAPTRPTIVVLCGSTRFRAEFDEAMAAMTLDGHIVTGPGVWVRSSPAFADLPPDEAVAIKARLDDLHKRKIDLADEVYVVNPGGYIGSSTRSEIGYAEAHGKPVRYLVQPVREADDVEAA